MRKIKEAMGKAGFARKSEDVLTESMLESERRIDLIRESCDMMAKKIFACLPQSQGKESKEITGVDRRIKRVPEFILGSSLVEYGSKLGNTSRLCLGEVLEEVGKIEMKVGSEMIEFEDKVEKLILIPLQKLIQEDIPNIFKSKKTLYKLAENLEAARGRLSQASHRQSASSFNGEKMANCKDEVEECQQKVDQSRENLAAEMNSVIRRESEIAQYIVMFHKFQTEYHQRISLALSELPPQIEGLPSNGIHQPVFGVDLVTHLSSTHRTIAYPIELCVCALLEIGLEEEGLFRMAGSTLKIKKLKSAFNTELFDLKSLLSDISDPHVISNVLKCYLRELPQPLLTIDLFPEWMSAIKIPDGQSKLQALWKVVQMLPEPNRNNLRYLIKFLKVLTSRQSVNKMNSSNVAIVIGPNLLWGPPAPMSQSEDYCGDNSAMGLTVTHLFSSIVDQLISYADWFFPDDVEFEFYVTCKKPSIEDDNDSSTSDGLSMTRSMNNGSTGTLNKTSIRKPDSILITKLMNTSQEEVEMSPPHSPKPVIRRVKNKPAPTPPIGALSTVAPSSRPLTIIGGGEDVKIQGQKNKQIESATAINITASSTPATPRDKRDRDGAFFFDIPPSPSQIRKQLERMGSGAGAIATIKRPQSRLGPPPKPPQPKDLIPEAEKTPTLKAKHSFNKSLDNELLDFSTDKNGYQSASLPRHFHTENSYKKLSTFTSPEAVPNTTTENENKPQDVVPVQVQVRDRDRDPSPAPPVQDLIYWTDDEKESKPKTDKKSESSKNVNATTTSAVPNERNANSEIPTPNPVTSTVTVSQLQTVNSKPVKNSDIPNPIPNASPRPVPAPRASLLGPRGAGTTTTAAPPFTSANSFVLKDVPKLVAKPRDLMSKGMRSHSRTSSSSGSGCESETGTGSSGRITGGSLSDDLPEYGLGLKGRPRTEKDQNPGNQSVAPKIKNESITPDKELPLHPKKLPEPVTTKSSEWVISRENTHL